VNRTAFEVVLIVLPRREDSRARHTIKRLLSVEVLGVVEAVLLVLYQVVVGAPVTGTHHKCLSRELQRLDTQLRDFLTGPWSPRIGLLEAVPALRPDPHGNAGARSEDVLLLKEGEIVTVR
jgi:hypothetical protein